MSRNKTLIIVEGARVDYNLMKHVLIQYEISDECHIIPYETNIYSLYNSMFKDTCPSDLDLLSHLKSREKDPFKKTIFDQKYTDILLIFDLDPHDTNFSDEKISEMTEYFVESTDMGKLYLNYPMIEAFYHMKSIPDDGYNSYTVSLAELKAKAYKSRVNEECRGRSYSKFAIDRKEITTVIKQNVAKAHRIAGTKIADYPPSQADLLNRQLAKMHTDNSVYVLCTCVFYIIDYNPRLLQ